MLFVHILKEINKSESFQHFSQFLFDQSKRNSGDVTVHVFIKSTADHRCTRGTTHGQQRTPTCFFYNDG